MKLSVLIVIIAAGFFTVDAYGQLKRLPSQDIPSPLGTTPSLADSIFFNGHDTAFWKKNKYFDLTSARAKDTSFVFGRMYGNECIIHFRLTITDTLKTIFLLFYHPGNGPELTPIDSMYGAWQLRRGRMIKTCSFYLNGIWGGMSTQARCLDLPNQCTTPLSLTPVNFILQRGRVSFII